MLAPWTQLPAKYRRIPEVRAQYLSVALLTPYGEYAEYQVSDLYSGSVHICKVYDDISTCDCTSATYSNVCAHKIAAKSHHSERKHLMSNPGQAVSLRPYRPGGGEDYEPKQVVLLEPGYYSGFLMSFSAPKLYEKFGGGGEEMKTQIRLLTTHSINERILPRLTVAQKWVKFNFFYNQKTKMESGYFSLVHALTAKQYSKDQLADLPEDKVPTLADLVGRPVVFEIKTSKDPDTNGIYSNNASNFKPITATMAQALVPTYKSLHIEINEKNGFPRITAPKVEYQEKLHQQNLAQIASYSNDTQADYDHADSEIPF